MSASLAVQPSDKAARALTLERKYASKILSLNPGFGEKAQEMASALIESGMSAGMCAMVLGAVFKGTRGGRGETTRVQWFMDAVKRRYSHELEKAQSDVRMFRSFVARMGALVESRDELKGAGLNLTFQNMMRLDEMGLDAPAIMALAEQHCHSRTNPMGPILKALRRVENGDCATLEAAIEEASCGWSNGGGYE